MIIKSKYQTASTDFVLTVTGECIKREALDGADDDKVHEVYFDALKTCPEAHVLLESSRQNMFQLLYCLVDPTAVNAWEQIVNKQYNQVHDHIKDDSKQPFYFQRGH